MAKKRQGEGWSFRPAQVSPPSTPQRSVSPGEQRCRVVVQKRAKGKIVTVIENLALSPDDLKQLGKELKNACGTGGTAKDGVVELQGDCQQRVQHWLDSHGWGRK